MIVSAAAGAGKTAVLTERLTRIVAAGTPERICACAESRTGACLGRALRRAAAAAHGRAQPDG